MNTYFHLSKKVYFFKSNMKIVYFFKFIKTYRLNLTKFYGLLKSIYVKTRNRTWQDVTVRGPNYIIICIIRQVPACKCKHFKEVIKCGHFMPFLPCLTEVWLQFVTCETTSSTTCHWLRRDAISSSLSSGHTPVGWIFAPFATAMKTKVNWYEHNCLLSKCVWFPFDVCGLVTW